MVIGARRTSRPAYPHPGEHMASRYFRIWQRLNDETGSEVVEWVLWVGAIVITLSAVFISVSGGVTQAVAAIFG
jgi:hypothetical protein